MLILRVSGIRKTASTKHTAGTSDRVDQRVADAAGGRESCRSDERHQSAAPAVADVIRHRHRRVSNPAGEVFRQERPDRPVHHPDVANENEDDEDRDRIVDVARLRDRSQPQIQRIVSDRRQQHASQDHRLAADDVGQPAKKDQARRCNEQRGPHDVGRGQRVHLGNLLQEVQRPELTAVPDHALPDQHDGGDPDIFDVGTEEGLLPGVPGHLAFGLDLLEDRRLLQLEPDIDCDGHQQEGHQERDAPGPLVEDLIAEIGARRNDHGQRHHDPERRGGLKPAGVVAAAFVRHVLGDIGDGAAILTAQAKALDHSKTEEDERGGQADLFEGRDQADRPGAEPHSAERHEEGVLAADAVAHPSKQEGSQRTDQKSRSEQRDRAEQGRDRVGLFKELD